MKRTFRVSDQQGTDMEVTLRIDTTLIPDDLAHEINRFWTGHEFRLDMADDDPYRAVAALAGAECMAIAMSDSWYGSEPQQIQRELLKKEGWPGSGVEVVSIYGIPIADSDYVDVEEIEA